jgi:hypothetical protein
MEPEKLKEKWEEICFILTEYIDQNIKESIYEQKVLMTLEKLGWSQYRKEVKLLSGSPNDDDESKPNIIGYLPDERPGIVIKVVRPSENIDKVGAIKKLIECMHNHQVDFGLLFGRELQILYDGSLNFQNDPLLLETIPFQTSAPSGHNFVAIFNKDAFYDSKYDTYIKKLIVLYKRTQKSKTLVQTLLSENTKTKIYQFLHKEFSEYGQDVAAEAIKKIKIDITKA